MVESHQLAGARRIVRRLAAEAEADGILFYGPDGSGKSILARELAQAWLCPQATEEGACGTCSVCTSYQAGRAVDFQEISPKGASRNIKVGAVRRQEGDDFTGIPILDYFRTRPLMARHKVVLLVDADRLTPAAGNSLLKGIEEMAPHTKLILTSSNFAHVLPTIRSRCLCIACGAEPGDIDLPAELLVFATTHGEAERIQKAQSVYRELLDVLASAQRHGPAGAMRAAEGLRGVAEKLGAEFEWGARQAQMEVLRAVGCWMLAQPEIRPENCQKVAEAHRLVEANVNGALVFDDLMAQVLI